MKTRTVAGSGEKSLLCDPGSELQVGRRERRWAKMMNMSKTKTNKKEPQPLFWDKIVKLKVICPQNGTPAVGSKESVLHFVLSIFACALLASAYDV